MLLNVLLDVKAGEEYPGETRGSSGMFILSPVGSGCIVSFN